MAVPDEYRVVVGSHAGIGVFDAASGERIVRIQDDDYRWFDESTTSILLPLEGGGTERLPCMSLWGGTLPEATSDGWRCEQVRGGVALVQDALRTLVADDEDFRACGFSPGGSVFALGTSPNLTIMRRRVVG